LAADFLADASIGTGDERRTHESVCTKGAFELSRTRLSLLVLRRILPRMAKTSAEQLAHVTARVLDRFTASGMLFTALDVSNAVKEALPDVRHRDVSPLVREAFDNDSLGSYAQTLIEVNAGQEKVKAYLYHPEGKDAALYDEAMRSQLAKPPQKGADTQVTDVLIEDSTLGASVPVGADGRGRVSRRLIQNAGIDSDDLFVQQINGTLRITAEEPDTDDGSVIEGEYLSFDHPDLLHLSASLLETFPKGAQLGAHVDGATVIVSSTSYATMPEANGFIPYPI
jgi:hypothetical protein